MIIQVRSKTVGVYKNRIVERDEVFEVEEEFFAVEWMHKIVPPPPPEPPAPPKAPKGILSRLLRKK